MLHWSDKRLSKMFLHRSMVSLLKLYSCAKQGGGGNVTCSRPQRTATRPGLGRGPLVPSPLLVLEKKKMVLLFYHSRAWRQCWSSGPDIQRKLWFTFAFCFDWPGSFGEERMLENNGHMHVYCPRGRSKCLH